MQENKNQTICSYSFYDSYSNEECKITYNKDKKKFSFLSYHFLWRDIFNFNRSNIIPVLLTVDEVTSILDKIEENDEILIKNDTKVIHINKKVPYCFVVDSIVPENYDYFSSPILSEEKFQEIIKNLKEFVKNV